MSQPATEPVPPAPAPAPPAAPTRPDGVDEAEWNALNDPGRTALVRERNARAEAERQLAAARARPAPPKADPAAPTPPAPAAPAKPADPNSQPDIAKLVTEAVAAAFKPFQEQQAQSQAEVAAQKIADAVLEAAKDAFVDPTDALTGINLTQITDGNGAADPAKIKTELDGLLQRKPHLGKPAGAPGLTAPPHAGPGGSTPPMETRVQSLLSQMQTGAGIRPPTTT